MSEDDYNSDGGPNPPSDDDFAQGEKTQLVDLESLRGGGTDPNFAPPPTVGDDDNDSSQQDEEFVEEKTQMFEPPPGFGDDDGAITSSASDSFGAQSPPFESSSSDGDFPGDDDGITSSAPSSPPSAPPPSSGSGPVGSGKMVIGDDSGGPDAEEATQFINVNDFAQQEQAHFTPEQQEAGYDGSTQFININELEAGNQGQGADPIESDRDLQRGYQFEPDDISRGEITVIHARNPIGKSVILRQVWEGSPDQMSTPLRERLAELNELEHPNLMTMNGMFVTDSGMWVEMNAPAGYRLTEVIEQHGPFPADQVLEWVDTIAGALGAVHARNLAYAGLTTDAVWISDDGQIVLEPFDMLQLEDRGNLGEFGPPELDAPPDQRRLSPATDVYSLAAVTAAALTGLPLRSDNLEANQDQLGDLTDAIRAGLNDAVDQRPNTVDQFVEQLRGGDGLDIKVVGGAVFAVLFLAVAALAVLAGDDDPAPADQPPADQQMAEEAIGDAPADGDPGQIDDSDMVADDTDGADADGPNVELPDTVYDDPRLTIGTSFSVNPPGDAETSATADQIDQWRQEADRLRSEGADAPSGDRYDYYAQALELLTRIIRAQPESDDQDLHAWHDIYTTDAVQEELDMIMGRIEQPLLEGRLGTVHRRYRRLANINPDADAGSFLSAHNTADVIELDRIGAEDDNDDD